MSALVVAITDDDVAARAAALVPGWPIVRLPPCLPAGEVVAHVHRELGEWPNRVVLAAAGPDGGRLVVASLTGWLPVHTIAAVPDFVASGMPLAMTHAVPMVLGRCDPDCRAIAGRLTDGGHPVMVVHGGVVEALGAVLSRAL